MTKRCASRNDAATLLLAILLLFLLQQITLLVESIYMLNLLQTSMDARALCIFFFYAPLFLLFARRPATNGSLFFFLILFVLTSLSAASQSTQWRIFFAGIAVSSCMLFIGMFFSRPEARRVSWAQSLSLAVLLSMIFRAFGSTLDISLTGSSRFLAWLLGLAALILGYYSIKKRTTAADEGFAAVAPNALRRTAAASGFMSCIALLYFVFASPYVMARWTESSYIVIYICAIVVLSFFIIVLSQRTKILLQLRKAMMIIWNALLIACLTLTIVRHSVAFPASSGEAPVIVSAAHAAVDMLVIVTLILFPIIFLNFQVCIENLQINRPSRLALPFTGAALFFSLLIFILIFTNVWGYVGEISRFFRNKFFMPFLLAGLGMIWPIFVLKRARSEGACRVAGKMWISIICLAGFATLVFVIKMERARVSPSPLRDELTILSYNIQQGVDYRGDKNYQKQLELIRRVQPDVICLQESDVARISGGNSDVVRYFAQKLAYHSYYGPKTVTGTFGTAILSRLPLENCRTFFTFSDVDEIGTSVAEINLHGKKIVIFNSHPDGGDAARRNHLEALIDQMSSYEYVIAAGDYNFHENSSYYCLVTEHLRDAWLIRWPDGIGQISWDSTSLGEFAAGDGRVRLQDRIDYIFVSANFNVLDAFYLPVPDSQSDHPAHWATLQF
ncbi:endonuclease/exonuclease/phosphatase family protein [candidate division KSB1 bacterium]|nr:endonuclease/exonuclease/phosphatase family protein [candidate division KSB1 bacterium]